MTAPITLPLPAEGPPDEASLRAAVDALAAGRPVVLPTETVYGLARRADAPGAGGRPALEGLHVADASGLSELVELPRVVQRLVERYLPGPLTLVVRPLAGAAGRSALGAGLEAVAEDGWAGVRVPAHAGTSAILAACPFPVRMGALRARAGEPPAVDARGAIAAAADAGAELVLDGGPSTLGQPSTVLAVARGRFELLREGIVAPHALRAAAGQRLLFVCTGNTCRSPMAEALARAAVRRALGVEDETRFGFEVRSAGVYAGPGAPPSENAVVAMADRGIDLSGHRSRPAIDREVAEHDRVYCLTASHRQALLSVLPPAAADRVELLDPEGRDVPDPFGGPLDVYRATANVLEAFIERRLGEWI